MWRYNAEEFLTNSLQKRLDQLTQEKGELESKLEAEQVRGNRAAPEMQRHGVLRRAACHSRHMAAPPHESSLTEACLDPVAAHVS